MIQAADSVTFYEPLISWADGNGYGLPCRMPGLAFPFVPLYWLFGSEIARSLVVVFQFVLTSISVYLLGQIAFNLFPKRFSFYLVVVLYALFPLTATYDWIGSADSIHVSLLIIILWFFILKTPNSLWQVLLLGLLLAWAIFIKEVFIVLAPIFACYLVASILRSKEYISKAFRYAIVLALPGIVLVAAWTGRNYKLYQELIPVRPPVEWCYSSINQEVQAAWKLVAAWGVDVGRFGAYSDWFRSKKFGVDAFPYPERVFTSGYNLDSLELLKNDVQQSLAQTPVESSSRLESKVIERSDRFLESYKSERPWSYYIFNRFRLSFQLMFPDRIDGLPFPAFANMGFVQKLIKVFTWLLWVLSSVSIFLGFCLFYKKILRLKRKVILVFALPLAVIFLLSFLVGFIEQRYFLTALPISILWLGLISGKLFTRLAERGKN